MVLRLYAIFDRVADDFGPLYQARNDAVAVRGARQALSKVGQLADFELHRLGTFDSETGEVTGQGVGLVSLQEVADGE